MAACTSSAQGPYFGDEHLLVVGVDADSEADAVIAQLAKSDKRLVRRLRGPHFTALGLSDQEGPALVRAVTARGIALILDPVSHSPLHAGVRYVLLEPPMNKTHDADGDGFDEIFVYAAHEVTEENCILVFRVRDSGFVDAVAGKGYAIVATSNEAVWRNPMFCGAEEDPDAGVKVEPDSAMRESP